MAYRDDQRFRKIYSYYRPRPRPADTSGIVDIAGILDFISGSLNGIDWKQSVRIASNKNVTITGTFTNATDIDTGAGSSGTLNDEDRILIKDQTNKKENGIYIWYSLDQKLVRTLDAVDITLTSGAACYVEEGTHESQIWFLKTYDPIIIGTTDLEWIQIGGGGGGGGDEYWFSTTAKAIYTTGSVAIRGEDAGIDAAEDVGSDVFFYVSGSISGSTGYDKKSVFGGDVKVSGSFSQGYLTFASGTYSHAEGNETYANGIYSHAEGVETKAYGVGSHAEGWNSNARGQFSHAEGNSVTAVGASSHAEGNETLASGSFSHAEGNRTQAIGLGSHAEGGGTIASGSYSHAEGLETIASGSYQHAGGKYNKRGNDFSLFVIGDGSGDADVDRSDIIRVNSDLIPGRGRFEVTGTVAATLGLSGSLTKLVDGTSYLIAGTNVTITSASNGAVTISASGGSGTGGSYWLSTTAKAIYATGSVAIRGDDVSIDAAEDVGSDVFFFVSGSISALNPDDKKSVFGGDVRISGSLAQGNQTLASGLCSHAEGGSSQAMGNYSHAEGSSYAEGVASHAEGQSFAYGNYSHSEGERTQTIGQGSHAEGYGTETSGSYSHAEGYYTIASGSHQHVGGKFNKRGNDFSLFVIGDGTGNSDTNRSDIVRVNSGSIGGAGSVQITGSLYVSGTSTFDSMGRSVNDIGTDVFFFISGSITGSGTADKKAVFGGDVVVSGSLTVNEPAEFFGDTMTLSGSLFASGNLYIDGNVYANVITASHGFSGSLTCLSDGTSYLVAGPNVTINTASNGSVEISSSLADSYWFSTVSDAIYTTGSVAIRGNDTGVYAAADKGTDVFFYVSGSITGSGAADKKAVFGGDTVISGSLTVHEFTELFGDAMILSGSLFASGNMYVDGNIYSSGIITASHGFSGSLTQLTDGTPYLIAGPNVTINTASNGSVEISSSYYAPIYWTSPAPDNILTTGSVTIAGDLTVNGDMTTVNTVNLEVKDAIIGLGFSSGTVALSADDRGIIGGIAGGDNVALIWKNVQNEFSFGRTDKSATGSLPIPLTSYANLHAANIQGSIITASIGFSGSLTKLTDNTDYLIAGTNINLVTGSKGQITINNVAPTFYQWNELSPTPELNTTASVILAGGQGSSYSTSNVGTDVFFFTSGSVGSRGGSIKGVSAFGGDVVITGSVAISGSAELSGDITEISGSLLVSGTTDINGDLYANNIYSSGIITASIGFSGSLTKLKDGTDYLIAGTNINLVTGSKGQVTINNVAPLFYQWNELSPSPSLNTTASVAIAGGLGSSYAASDNGTDVFFFVSGSISGSSPNDKKSVFGGDVRISGSLAQGFFPDASGKQSHAQGVLTKASGLYSHAEGYQSITTGETSHAEGFQNTAAGDYSHAEGQYSSANGVSSHAEGNHATATGVAAHAEGDHTTAYGYYSHAEGSYTTADGYYSHAEGQRTYTEINADYSHAEGYYTITSGTHSHVEGYYAKTTFGGQYSHAEGAYTTGSALYSHAEGERTITVGRSSHAEGYYTIASGTYQHVGGKYNKRGNDFSLFVIGDGTGDSDANRSDIVRVNSGATGGTGRFEVTGTLAATQGLSGSLTQLVDGTSYLIAGNNTTITSASNGSVTISAIPTSPVNSVQFNDTGAFGGSSNFNFYNSSNTLAITGTLGMKGDVVPDADYTYNLGASGLRWANVYTGDLHLKNDRGDWTIVEEKDYLCVVNNITGKKYKMMLQEIKDES